MKTPLEMKIGVIKLTVEEEKILEDFFAENCKNEEGFTLLFVEGEMDKTFFELIENKEIQVKNYFNKFGWSFVYNYSIPDNCNEIHVMAL